MKFLGSLMIVMLFIGAQSFSSNGSYHVAYDEYSGIDGAWPTINLSSESSVQMAKKVASGRGIDLQNFHDPEVTATWGLKFECTAESVTFYIKIIIDDMSLYSYALDSAGCIPDRTVQFVLGDGSELSGSEDAMPLHTPEEILQIARDLMKEAGLDAENHEFLGMGLLWRVYFEGKAGEIGNHFTIVINDQTLESRFVGGR